MTTLKINEIFSTIQGEGPNTGKPSVFVRLAGCNLRCYWCDTTYTWLYSQGLADKIRLTLPENLQSYPLEVYDRNAESHQTELSDIIKTIQSFKIKHVVITGGEPLLQIKKLDLLTKSLLKMNYTIEIETNGTKSPEGLSEDIRFNVSPKLKNSNNPKSLRYQPEILDIFVKKNSIFKFVLVTQKDLIEVEEIIAFHNIIPNKVYLMPEGKTTPELRAKSSWIIDICKARNYNYCHRLHIDLFDQTRGV